MAKNARFWTYINGLVKITLKPEQTLNHSKGGITDEGFHLEDNTWHFDGEFVNHERTVNSRDCDGRLDTHDSYICHVNELSDDFNDYTEEYMPMWVHADSNQRDYSAEAAGY